MADAALAAAKVVGLDRIGCINLAIDITAWCDCAGFAGRPIVPNLGVFASPDPVAVDMACIDAATAAPGIPGSVAEQYGVMGPGIPKFSACSSVTGNSQFIQLKAGQKNGLGTMSYDLERVDQVPSARPYVSCQVPLGARFKKLFDRLPLFPDGGYRRAEEVDLEELR